MKVEIRESDIGIVLGITPDTTEEDIILTLFHSLYESGSGYDNVILDDIDAG